MSDKELATTMLAVTRRCAFVNFCTQPANDPNTVIVELPLSLALMLPPGRSVLIFNRNEFSEASVREEYERSVVRPAQELYEKAVELAKVPKTKP